MVASSWNDDRFDDWEGELDRGDGHPVIAIAIGSAVVIGIAIVALNLVTGDFAAIMPAAFGIAALTAVVVFGALWFATLREAALGWQIGAGAIFLALAMLSVVIGVAIANVGQQMDAANVRRIHIDAAGEPVLPPGTKAGPITNATLAFIREGLNERRKRDAIVNELGLDRIASAMAVEADLTLVQDCGRIPRRQPELDASYGRTGGIVARYRGRINTIVTNPALRKAIVTDLDENMKRTMVENAKFMAIQHRLFALGEKLCRVLLPKRWRAIGEAFQFSSGSDADAFDVVIDQWNAAVGEQNAMAQAWRARLNSSGIADASSKL